MYEVSDEIYEYMTHEDFLKLVSVPGLTENDIQIKTKVRNLVSNIEC